MSTKKKSLLVIVSGVLILALSAGSIALVTTSVASAQSTKNQGKGMQFSQIAFQQDGKEFMGPGRPGLPGEVGDLDKYLAEALGISVEELQSAHEAAQAAAVQAAVESGELTEEQASLMQALQTLKGYVDPQVLTAEALGITVEQLKAAREDDKSLRDLMDELGISKNEFQTAVKEAREASFQKAVKDGVITQEQADLLQSSKPDGEPGDRGDFRGRDGPDLLGRGVKMDSYLAEALGISVEELQAAREKASAAAMEDAVKSGEVSEEQASQMQARQALRNYIDPGILTAKALGVTFEELQAAREDGKSPRDLMDELGISPEDFRTAMQEAYKAAVQQAVDDGVITQEQADLILNTEAGFGQGGLGMFPRSGGQGRPGGPGFPPGQRKPGGIDSAPGLPNSPTSENNT